MIGQAGLPGQQALIRGTLLLIFVGIARIAAAETVALEIGLPVDIVHPLGFALDLLSGRALCWRGGRLFTAGRLLFAFLFRVGAFFQHGVFRQLLGDHIDQLHPRQLQQLDRLLQLRGHHQLLTQFYL